MIRLKATGALAAVLLGLTALPVSAADWYQHQYGEMRANFGDWLAVCAEAGAGACRVTTAGKDPGSAAFFDYRLTLHFVEGMGEWNIEVMDRGMPESALQYLLFDFDNELVRLLPGMYQPGELGVPNVAETVSVVDFQVGATLVEKMKSGADLKVSYDPPGYDGQAKFSLGGISAAMRAVEDHSRQRLN